VDDTIDKATENKLRRMADRLGYELHKSRARHIHVDNLGGYQIIDKASQTIVDGAKFELRFREAEIVLANREFDLTYHRRK
jgi:hypothetical protein